MNADEMSLVEPSYLQTGLFVTVLYLRGINFNTNLLAGWLPNEYVRGRKFIYFTGS